MALTLLDRVWETTTTTSTGTYSLGGPLTGYQGFSAVGEGATCPYTVSNGTDWEIGIGTYSSAGGGVLTRTTIKASSNSNNAVDWPAGTKNIFSAPSAFVIKEVEVKSGNINSGQVGQFHLSSGAVNSGAIASGQIGVFHYASGSVLSGAIASGQIGAFHLASGAVNSGAIASGQIGVNHHASGSVLSGAIASGQIGKFHVASGAVNSGHIASGAIAGQAGGGAFNIGSGTINSFDLGSGAIVSGNIASGQVGTNHIARLSVTNIHYVTQSITSGKLANFSIYADNIGSGEITATKIASGAVAGQVLGAWSCASGTVGPNDLASGAVASGHTASGSVATFGRSAMFDDFVTGETVSGAKPVMFLSGTGAIGVAQGASGFRMPAFGINLDNALSGIGIRVVTYGRIQMTSGMDRAFSGQIGKAVWVSSSGDLVTATKPTASTLSQRIGTAISGGVFVNPGPVSSGNLSYGQSGTVTF